MKNNKIDTILKHFKRADPLLFSIANKFEIDVLIPRPESEYFKSLCREVIGQQLAKKVAKVIFERFENLFIDKKITAQQILKIDENKLRGAGMAWSKVNCLKDLATKTIDKTVVFEKMVKKENEEIMEELLNVKGIGPWTAEMFMIFTLGREDIFSQKDLGLKKSIMKLYNLKNIDETILNKITKKWSPYKTYASLLLWKNRDF